MTSATLGLYMRVKKLIHWDYFHSDARRPKKPSFSNVDAGLIVDGRAKQIMLMKRCSQTNAGER